MASIYIAVAMFCLSTFVGIGVKSIIKSEYEKVVEYVEFLKYALRLFESKKSKSEEVFRTFIAEKKRKFIPKLNEDAKNCSELKKERPFAQGEYERIVEFWKNVGAIAYSDLNNYFMDEIVRAENFCAREKLKYEKNGVLYGKLGVVAGLFLFVLLI